MNLTWHPIVLSVCLMLYPVAQAAGGENGAMQGDAAEQRERMLAEDLEVLATILRHDLEMLYGIVPMHPLHPVHDKEERISQPLATYVEDYGAVIQMRVPPPVKEEPKADTEDVKPLTRWEQTRRALREGIVGRELFATLQCAECHVTGGNLNVREEEWQYESGRMRMTSFYPYFNHPLSAAPATVPKLVDTVLAGLMENGRHIRGLQPDHRITVAVQFRTGATNDKGPRERAWLSLDGFGELVESLDRYEEALNQYEEALGLVERKHRTAPPEEKTARSGSALQVAPARITISVDKQQLDALADGTLSEKQFRDAVRVDIFQ